MNPILPLAVIAALLVATREDKGGVKPPQPGALPRVWDPASAQRIARLHPKIRADAAMMLTRAELQGIKLRVTSTLRTYAEQDALYAQGRTKPGGIVTNAKAGTSWHNFGLAFDVVAIDADGKADWNGPWEKIAQIGKSLGLEWGGDWKSFKDKPHFQKTFGRSLAEMRALVASGRTEGGYAII